MIFSHLTVVLQWISQRTLFPDSSVFFTPLVDLSNGIRTFIAWLPKAVIRMTVNGALWSISIILSSGSPSKLPSSMKWKSALALDFISLLIQHIPDAHYKMTRYYGLYARHRDIDKHLRKSIHPCKHEFLLSLVKWRNNIALSFGYDPLYCDKCKGTMTLTDLYFNHKRVPLEDMYERAIAKFKCRSSWFFFRSVPYF